MRTNELVELAHKLVTERQKLDESGFPPPFPCFLLMFSTVSSLSIHCWKETNNISSTQSTVVFCCPRVALEKSEDMECWRPTIFPFLSVGPFSSLQEDKAAGLPVLICTLAYLTCFSFLCRVTGTTLLFLSGGGCPFIHTIGPHFFFLSASEFPVFLGLYC